MYGMITVCVYIYIHILCSTTYIITYRYMNSLQNPHELFLFELNDHLDIQVLLLFLWSRTCIMMHVNHVSIHSSKCFDSQIPYLTGHELSPGAEGTGDGTDQREGHWRWLGEHLSSDQNPG